MNVNREAPRKGITVMLPHKGAGTRGNPYLGLLYRHLADQGATVLDYSKRSLLRGVDIWHLHWPENSANRAHWADALRGAAKLLLLCALARLRGARIVWTLHNERSHENPHPLLERSFLRLFVRNVSATISPSEHGAKLLANSYPRLRRIPSAVIPLGHYRGYYRNDVPQREARRLLGLDPDDHVLGFFGAVRAYKNLPTLIRVFREWTHPKARLLIAGMPENAAIAEQLRLMVQDDDRVRLSLQRIDDDRIQHHLNALDVLVLPFHDVLNSSSVLLGLSFGLPVVAPRLGALEEVQRVVGREWLRLYEGALSVSTLETLARGRAPGHESSPDLGSYDWHRIGSDTYRYFAELTGRRAR